MTESLRQRLLAIDTLRPYVWKLRLTEEEYRQLQTYVMEHDKVINREYAILAIIYIAEWYKREYNGSVINPLGGISAESLWAASASTQLNGSIRQRKTIGIWSASICSAVYRCAISASAKTGNC